MKVLITGAKGFVGKNLVAELRARKQHELYEFDLDTPAEMLGKWCADCDFVFNLAGVNRPKEQSEFMTGNFGFASTLLDTLKKHGNKCPVMISSSIQASLDNPYGKSKKAGEELMFEYSRETGAPVLVYRFPNVFGKWCRPNYNSAVATFCNNIANGLPITVNDRNTRLTLVYIDDVVEELCRALDGNPNRDGAYCAVPVSYQKTLGEIVDLLESFRESRKNLDVPDMGGDLFSKKLYSAYLSYLPEDGFSYPLNMHCDNRGSFTEILRTAERGQFSVNISKPGIAKGNHWHHTKNEKYVVVSGRALIQFRKVGDAKVIDYHASGDRLEVVDIPCGYVHRIVNEGEGDLVTFMWCNECYDPRHPDCNPEEV